LQSAVAALLQRDNLPDLSNFANGERPLHLANSTSPADSANGNLSTTESVIAPIDMTEPSTDRQADDPGLVQAPMSNLYELTRALKSSNAEANALQNAAIEQDLISRGILTIDRGEQLFGRFMKNHHQLLWGGIIIPYKTLDEVRRASVLLSTAIFTVASLHSPGGGGPGTLQRCYDTFVSLVSSTSLSRNHNLDDVRALCLGAFYLPNLSWRLSGQAARMAAEMNIHQSFSKLMNGDMRHAERVRLWYALFVCDRHFSIAYGRPSAMNDDAAIKGVERFIASPASVSGDVRISAQVALFRILSEAYMEFGSDQNQPLSEKDLEKLRMFNIEIDQWRLLWQPRSLDSPGIGSYPSKGVVLYYHFARFQLNSLALRGVRWPTNEPLWLNRREAAMAAISAAVSTLICILSEGDIRKALNGVPLFTHTMVAFCATFLLKIAGIWSRGGDALSQALGLGFNLSEVVSLTRRSADLLSEVAEDVSEKHMTRLIVAGIRELLQRVNLPDGGSTNEDTIGHDRGGTSMPRMETGAAADFATEQMGDGVHGMIYNMDLDSLAGLLEYSSDQYLETFAGNEFDSWGPPT
jgi:hypothetical protein